jgi:hypothetical protein
VVPPQRLIGSRTRWRDGVIRLGRSRATRRFDTRRGTIGKLRPLRSANITPPRTQRLTQRRLTLSVAHAGLRRMQATPRKSCKLALSSSNAAGPACQNCGEKRAQRQRRLTLSVVPRRVVVAIPTRPRSSSGGAAPGQRGCLPDVGLQRAAGDGSGAGRARRSRRRFARRTRRSWTPSGT